MGAENSQREGDKGRGGRTAVRGHRGGAGKQSKRMGIKTQEKEKGAEAVVEGW